MLIAEIGNNHFGSMRAYKEMIRVAHESGADLIKGQAFRAADIKTGSMPQAFYKMCELSEAQMIELVWFARNLGNDLFFSVFSPGFEKLRAMQKWRKYAASQTREIGIELLPDDPDVIASVPVETQLHRDLRRPKHAELLHVTGYLPKNAHLDRIGELSRWLGRPVGYSDHCLGVDTAIAAVREYGSVIVEKHFTLEKNVSYLGEVYRDTVHGATPSELERLAKAMHE
jgi:sialic acid synthase SpsE